MLRSTDPEYQRRIGSALCVIIHLCVQQLVSPQGSKSLGEDSQSDCMPHSEVLTASERRHLQTLIHWSSVASSGFILFKFFTALVTESEALKSGHRLFLWSVLFQLTLSIDKAEEIQKGEMSDAKDSRDERSCSKTALRSLCLYDFQAPWSCHSWKDQHLIDKLMKF